MAQIFNRKTASDEVAIDSCPVIDGYENANPVVLIAANKAFELENRITILDAINYCRPGIIRQVNNALAIVSGGYFVGGIYLLTDGSFLYTYNAITKTLANVAAVPFVPGLGNPAIRSVPGGGSSGGINVMFFNQGGGLYYWDGTNLITVSMPVASPNMSFPVWQNNGLMCARTGTADISVADTGTVPPNFGPGNNDITVRVTLDSDGADSINGMASFASNILLAGKRGRIYAIVTDRSVVVANWSRAPVSTSIGIAEHETMKMVGNSMFFLSESGNGVYSIDYAGGTSIPIISGLKSADIKPDIERINWNAINTARAITWQGHYLLAVPVDGSAVPNCILVYSAIRDSWQGIWVGKNGDGTPAKWRHFALNPSALAGSELLVAFDNGDIGLQTKAVTKLFNDIDITGTPIPIASHVFSRGFHWDEIPMTPSASGQPYNVRFINQVQPYSCRLRFSKSIAPVDVDLSTESSYISLWRQGLSTTTKKLQLPHALPWNLDTAGDKYQQFNIQDACESCTEVQVKISGVGDWRLHKIDVTAYVDRTATNT